jgi:Conjugative transposon protein TcpC
MVRKATPEDGLRPAEFAADDFAGDWAAPDGPAPDGPAPDGPVANGPVPNGPVPNGPVPNGTVPGGTGPGGALPGATRQSVLARRRPPPGSGAGGRWLVWSLRAVLWAVLLVIGFRGVASIVGSFRQSGRAGAGGTPSSAPAGTFPTAPAEAFALQFGYVYLNFSPGAATQRAADLTPFIPVGSDPQFGWNGSGSQQLQSEQVASVTVHSAHQATITLLARVNSGLVELGVPVYAAQDGLVVSAEPALLPAPGRISPPPAPRSSSDPAARTALSDQLPGFFRAYASGDQQTLARFLAPGAVVTGLGGTVTFGSLNAIEVPAGGATRQIEVTVAWQMPALEPPPPPPPPPVTRRSRLGAEASPTPAPSATPPPVTPAVQTTYEMTVVRLRGAWYIKAIGPSAAQPGGP